MLKSLKDLDCGVLIKSFIFLETPHVVSPVEESLLCGGDVQLTQEVHTIAMQLLCSHCVKYRLG